MLAVYLVAGWEWGRPLALGAWYLAQGYTLAFCAYVLAPAGLYLLRARAVARLFAPPPPAPALTDFILLVPAHNEERLLPGLLASIGQLAYPPERYTVLVVADNCTDHTARLARQAGAACLERRTAHPSSKAQALRYATQVLAVRPGWAQTVVCVLDADCRLDPQFLTGLNQHFAQAGAAPVVQASRRVANAFASDVTLLDAAAEALRQRVGAATRRLLGLESFLFGLGCCARGFVFSCLVVLPEATLAEDKEWKAYLTRHRVPVAYCPAASLRYEAVHSGPAFARQRQRWLAGQLAAARTHGLAMLGQGLRRGWLSQLDFACELLLPPRSVLLVVALGFGAAGLAGAPAVLLGGGGWLALAAALLGYGALGLRLVGAGPRHLWALLTGGRLVVGVVRSAVLILLGYKDKEWKPTRVAPAAAGKKLG